MYEIYKKKVFPSDSPIGGTIVLKELATIFHHPELLNVRMSTLQSALDNLLLPRLHDNHASG